MESWAPILALAVLSAAALALFWNRMDPALRPWIVAGLMLRLVGSQIRAAVMSGVYGRGDAVAYFTFGQRFAGAIWEGDFRFIDQQIELTGRWWSTSFVCFSSAFVQALFVDDMRALFYIYSLFSFVGLLLCISAWKTAMGDDGVSYAKWLLLAPSLWFWPSSIGKETFVLLGLGLTLYGYAGAQGRPKALWVLAGLGLLTCIRPHIAALVALGASFSELVSLRSRFRLGGVMSVLVIVVGVIGVVILARSQLGLEGLEMSEIQQEYEFRSLQTQQGGSRMEATTGFAAAVMAFVNVLFRPFPWDPGSNRGLTLFASAEVITFWFLNRSAMLKIPALFRHSVSDRYNRFLLITAVILILLYGVAYQNLGLLTRQRVIVLPLVISLVLFAKRLARPAPRVLSVAPPQGVHR